MTTEYADSLADLRFMICEGDTIHVLNRSVSRSGMSRRVDLFIVRDGDLRPITYRASTVLGLSRNDVGMLVRGGGMDMGFHVVYSLAQALFGDGYALSHRWI